MATFVEVFASLLKMHIMDTRLLYVCLVLFKTVLSLKIYADLSSSFINTHLLFTGLSKPRGVKYAFTQDVGPRNHQSLSRRIPRYIPSKLKPAWA
jgi:hypothetical protein